MSASGRSCQDELRRIEQLLKRIESLELKENVLERERDTLYSLLDSFPGFVFLRAPDYSIRYANRYFLDHFGETGKRACHEIIKKRKEPCETCRMLETFATGKPRKWEWSNEVKHRSYQIYDFPFKNLDGQYLVLEFGIDITDLKLKEEQLRILSEKERDRQLFMSLKSRQASMGEMLGNVAHQWRQPLNLISLLISDIRESYEEGSISEDYLDSTVNKIMDAIQYMSQTIDDFCDFYRPEKEKKTFSVLDAINRSVAFMDTVLKKNNIVVETVTGDDVFIKGYPNEFAHVILNIIKNAKDVFAERKTPAPRITIGAFEAGGRGVVTIADNAGGIPEEIVGRVFEPYFTTKHNGNGIGIGLYMSKIIIEANMDGRISVRNIPGGAEFRIEV